MALKFSKKSTPAFKNTSVDYHNIFDYKLTEEEAIRWQYKKDLPLRGKSSLPSVKGKSQLQREKYSKSKLLIAKKAASLISIIPTVKFVGITGSLAMNNAGKDSDIDLIIITKSGYLWTTRFLCYVLIWLFNYKTRKPKDKFEKDKLCLNMWIDQEDLVWNKKDRNIYTAHEIAQIVPLINKDGTYQKFIYLNKWILNYWPNAVKVTNFKNKDKKEKNKRLRDI